MVTVAIARPGGAWVDGMAGEPPSGAADPGISGEPADGGARRARLVHLPAVHPGAHAEGAPGVQPVVGAPDEWVAPSWEDVVRDHGPRVYRLAYRLTGNRYDAEDLTQETFVRVFRSLPHYTPGTFEGWLHRITTNLFLDMARRRSKIRFEGLPEDAERIVGTQSPPDQLIDDRMFDADVEGALDALPAEFRAAVVLCDVEGLSYEQIAAVLGVKLGTVRSRIHRGRAALRSALADRAASRGDS